MNFQEQLQHQLLFFDGAMGTILQAKGLKGGELPELWNLSHPEWIASTHEAYLRAGCHIIKTNTFGANRLKLESTGHTVEEVAGAAVDLARQSVNKINPNAFVAMDIGPTGKLMKPFGDLPFEEAYGLFADMAKTGQAHGADLILIETMSDTYEIKAAVLAAKENTSLPILVTMIFDDSGKLLTGSDIPTAVTMLEGLGVDGIGFNCGLGPEQMKSLLPTLLECCHVPVILNPNAGLPVSVNGATSFQVGPEEFAQTMRELGELGANVLGGCCGTTPAHIRELVNVCSSLSPRSLSSCTQTCVCSYSKQVVFGEKPILIGERINPTGKSRFKQALREQDINYILQEGIRQQEWGADVLDVNVGLPEIDEPAMMEQVITQLQGVSDLPLQIDTSDLKAMEKALRLYNGKPLVNSVNGKQESMHAVFPLVKKYGGVVVCLTLDEQGIPETAEGRVEVARKLIQTAASYGIGKQDLVMDPLAMTISTSGDAARITLEALRRIRFELGVHTILGVSNISFGLPLRENINAAFFTMAMQNGLSAGIIHPGSEAMMRSYYAYCALSGADAQCAAYIGRYAGQTAASAPLPSSDSGITLQEAIIKGLKESAYAQAKQQAQARDGLDIINQDMIPALDVVGKGFENNTIFLPQLLMSAEAAKAAFAALKEEMSRHPGTVAEQKEKIILATVKGDIHDIGKNIVKVLLENYGFDVIDLGKDVEPQLVADTAKNQQVRLVGLSALMTTTVTSMEETIALLHQTCPDCKVMVGGAVLTQSYADQIGADFYSKDAMGSVRYANRLFEKE